MIEYKLIYRENGTRKQKIWEYNGKPAGKKFKEWATSVSSASNRIYMQSNVEYLAGSWKGLPKKKGK